MSVDLTPQVAASNMRLLEKLEKKIEAKSNTTAFVFSAPFTHPYSLKEQIESNLCFLQTTLSSIPSPVKEPEASVKQDTTDAQYQLDEHSSTKRAREEDEVYDEPQAVCFTSHHSPTQTKITTHLFQKRPTRERRASRGSRSMYAQDYIM